MKELLRYPLMMNIIQGAMVTTGHQGKSMQKRFGGDLACLSRDVGIPKSKAGKVVFK